MGHACTHLSTQETDQQSPTALFVLERSIFSTESAGSAQTGKTNTSQEGKNVRPAVGDGTEDVYSETSTALQDDHEDASIPYPANSFQPLYGHPVPPEIVADMIPPGDAGLLWNALLVGHAWYDPNECLEDREIKPRRYGLPIRCADFFSSLVTTSDHRCIFSGVLNGWPGLTCLELLSIARPVKGRNQSTMKPCWEANSDGNFPSAPPDLTTAQLTLRMPPWSSRGWSRDNPGWVWWFFAQRSHGPVLSWGQNMGQVLLRDLQCFGETMPKVVAAHQFVHRYAVGSRSETRADLATYHSAVLLEWDHGRYTTVVELGPMGGIAARRGRSDWYDDKLDDCTALSRTMPACMVMPWREDLAEIRCSDVQAVNLDEFKSYVQQYTGHDHRFVDPQFPHSGSVRLSRRSQLDIMEYLYNYMAKERKFDVRYRSCQTFACDLFSVLTGQSESVKPWNPFLAKTYHPHPDWFLYSPVGDHPPFLDEAKHTQLESARSASVGSKDSV